MKSKFCFSILLCLLSLSISAAAHPLGNFSINQYSGIEVSGSRIKVRQVLDMAEIPTFQASALIDTDKNGQLSQEELNKYAADLSSAYLHDLHLLLNDQQLSLNSVNTNISLGQGAGDLPLIRIVWDLAADVPELQKTNRISFENRNNANRVGWNEIVVNSVNGVAVFNSTAYGSGLSDELRAYPQELLSAPLGERSAEFSFAADSLPADAKPLRNRDGKKSAPVQKDRLAELISVPEITPAIVLLGLLAAFGLGALHAMSPGHGKTVVGAYLVGSRGTAKHAAFLGLTVTITHTIGVFALGLITLFASNYFFPERIMPFLSFVTGLLVFYIGISLFKNRLFSALGWKRNEYHHDHSHEHGHDHAHEHTYDGLTHTHGGTTHTHLPPENISLKSLLGLGISGGLLPCPSALVLMLSAISLGRVGYGLVLTLVFSLGLAATLTAVGFIFLYVGKAFGGATLSQNRLIKILPVFSALVIACIGAFICYNSFGATL